MKRTVFLGGFFLMATSVVQARRMAPPAAQPKTRLPIQIGSCSATLESNTPWLRSVGGTFTTQGRRLTLIPQGTSLRIPILAAQNVRVNPRAPSFPIDARLLPIPQGGMFAELASSSLMQGPVSAGIDTGANIRRRASGIFLDPNKSYLYFTATTPFVLNLSKRGKNSPPQGTKQERKGKTKFTTTAFALDPCDPAVFFGGVTANVSGITMTLEGIGFSLKGNVHHRTQMQVWSGGTRRDGTPQLKPYDMKGHVYLKGTVGVGVGKFLSLSGTATATVDLDPKQNGVWGIREAVGMFQGRMPRTLPDFRLLLEGSQQMNLAGLSVPFAKVAVGINASDARNIRIQVGGERSRGASLADVFSGAPPEVAKLIVVKGRLQIFVNASFNATNPRPNGQYQAKIRGVMEVAGARVEGDVDISYRVGGRPMVCAKLPGLQRLCGKELEDGIARIGKEVAKAAKTVEKAFAATCPGGYRKTATHCESMRCNRGYEKHGSRCLASCPANSKYSATKVHCMTKVVRATTKKTKVWVGHLKKPKKYRKACPAGMSYTHDLAGYSYCKKTTCPRGYPTLRGGNCHTSCGGLKTDAFGNCVVKSQAPKTVPLGCPNGYRRDGLLCIKR